MGTSFISSLYMLLNNLNLQSHKLHLPHGTDSDRCRLWYLPYKGWLSLYITKM